MVPFSSINRIWAPLSIGTLFLCLAISTGCSGNQAVLQSGRQSPTPASIENKLDSFESDLNQMKTAGFTWLYVVRRRDGAPLDTEDKNLLRAATGDANRRVLSDSGRAVIVGSNYAASLAGIDSLKTRFDVADLSPPPTPTPQSVEYSNTQPST
ncbi:MAG: hypothetical protein ABR530_02440 [Pyrinomonadaceae bacterium]